jgi:phosphoglycerate dehydrogenase-like enzyme
MKLVVYPAVEPERLDKIVEAAGAMQVVNAADDRTAQMEIADADAFFGKITRPLLAAAKNLRWIQSPTASLEHYIFPELVEHPAVLTNMRGLYSDVIAEHVLGMMLAFTRNLHTYIRNQATGTWSPVGGEETRVSFATGPGMVNAMDHAHRTLGELALGLVGLGSIGSEIARRASQFDMRVLAVDPIARKAPEGVSTLWPTSRLDEMLAEADMIVVAAPHTPETRHLFTRGRFQKMKRSAYFINIGRGAIVKLDDLVAALEAGEIAGAGLDVFEIEPLPADHPLWRFPNVILTPHIAGQAVCVPARHLGVVVNNVHRFINGQPLINAVDKARWF